MIREYACVFILEISRDAAGECITTEKISAHRVTGREGCVTAEPTIWWTSITGKCSYVFILALAVQSHHLNCGGDVSRIQTGNVAQLLHLCFLSRMDFERTVYDKSRIGQPCHFSTYCPQRQSLEEGCRGNLCCHRVHQNTNGALYMGFLVARVYQDNPVRNGLCGCPHTLSTSCKTKILVLSKKKNCALQVEG